MPSAECYTETINKIMYFYFLGSNPTLSLSELESVLGFSNLNLETPGIASSKLEFNINRLGGTIKIAEQIEKINLNDDLILKLKDIVLAHSPKSGGKLNFGLSVYGRKMSPPKLTELAFELKKNLKPKLNLRITPNKKQDLSSAQTVSLKIGKSGMELNLIYKKNHIIIAKTTQIQNLKNYTLRDHGRPARDARVGMLPPKLAQIMLNLSSRGTEGGTVLDPFCGTGVVLQESLLAGFDIIGSDIEPRMIEMTEQNLDFISHKFHLKLGGDQIKSHLSVQDATSGQWSGFNFVVSEVFLGRPLNKLPDDATLKKIIDDVNLITKKFLLNLKGQIGPDVRICLAVPAWRKGKQIIDLPLIDELEDLGYNRMSLKFASEKELIYYREASTVARRLLLL